MDSTGVLAKEGCTEDARCFNIVVVLQRIPLFQNPWQGVQTVGGQRKKDILYSLMGWHKILDKGRCLWWGLSGVCWFQYVVLDAKIVISCKLGWIYLTNKTPVVDPVYCTPVNAEEETGWM